MTKEELETENLRWFSVKKSRDIGKVNGVQRGDFLEWEKLYHALRE